METSERARRIEIATKRLGWEIVGGDAYYDPKRPLAQVLDGKLTDSGIVALLEWVRSERATVQFYTRTVEITLASGLRVRADSIEDVLLMAVTEGAA